MTKELEGICKERAAAASWKYCPAINLQGMKQTVKTLVRLPGILPKN
jgi:hypothetical protein